jgi:hypothetical protein
MKSDGRICSIEGCGRPWDACGLCAAHYQRLRQHGDVDATRPVVGRRAIPAAPPRATTPLGSPCREWQGSRTPQGYGTAYFGGRRWYVHRWVWTEILGPIPEGQEIMHLCDNPACFRLDHLRMGTHADNMRDMVAKGRRRNQYESIGDGSPCPWTMLLDIDDQPRLHCTLPSGHIGQPHQWESRT